MSIKVLNKKSIVPIFIFIVVALISSPLLLKIYSNKQDTNNLSTEVTNHVLGVSITASMPFPSINNTITSPTTIIPSTVIVTSSISTNVQKNLYSFKIVSAWLPSWDYKNAKDSFYRNITKFTDINPTYYNLNDNGDIQSNSVSCDQDLIKKSHNNNVRVVPTITNSSKASFSKLSLDNIKLKSHNDFIISEINKCHYDGIDIDYEALAAQDKNTFTNLFKDLSDKLHKESKILSIFVSPKDPKYDSDTQKVQDLSFINQNFDQVKTYTYDYSSTAGPNSPIYWDVNILNSFLNQISPSKLIFGIPLYGTEYTNSNVKSTKTYLQIQNILASLNQSPTIEDSSKEKYIEYYVSNQRHQIWYQDSDSIKYRYDLAKSKDIAGIALWRLGSEDNNSINLLK